MIQRTPQEKIIMIKWINLAQGRGGAGRAGAPDLGHRTQGTTVTAQGRWIIRSNLTVAKCQI